MCKAIFILLLMYLVSAHGGHYSPYVNAPISRSIDESASSIAIGDIGDRMRSSLSSSVQPRRQIAHARTRTWWNRAKDFFLNTWDTVNKQTLGARIEFENGAVPEGYSPVFDNSIEGFLGEAPIAWRFWNRPNVGSKVESGLSVDHHIEGEHSIAIKLTANGKDEALAIIYRSAAVESHTKYCLNAQVRAPGSTHSLALTFRRLSEKARVHNKERTFSPNNSWHISTLCTEIPANEKIVEVTAWLGVRTKDSDGVEVWFDDIGLYSKP